MKRFITRLLTALGLITVLATVAIWSEPRLLAAVKAALIRDVDNPAMQPFQAAGSCSLGGGCCCGNNVYTVPSGKRAVVEYVSAQCPQFPSGFGCAGFVQTTLNGVMVSHSLRAVPASNGTFNTVGQQVRIYGDAGTVITAGGYSTGGPATGTINLAISGYLVDLP